MDEDHQGHGSSFCLRFLRFLLVCSKTVFNLVQWFQFLLVQRSVGRNGWTEIVRS